MNLSINEDVAFKELKAAIKDFNSEEREEVEGFLLASRNLLLIIYALQASVNHPPLKLENTKQRILKVDDLLKDLRALKC